MLVLTRPGAKNALLYAVDSFCLIQIANGAIGHSHEFLTEVLNQVLKLS